MIRREERFSAEQRIPRLREKNSDGKRLVAQSVLLGGVSVLDSMAFILLVCGGKRNRTIVLNIKGTTCTLFVKDFSLEQPDAPPFSEDQSFLSVTNFEPNLHLS